MKRQTHKTVLGVTIALCLILLKLGAGSATSQEDRRFTEYVYDDAGRIVGINVVTTGEPPQVDAITPDQIRIGPATPVTATGSGLRASEVTSDHSGIAIGAVTPTATEVIFEITVDESVPLGPHELTFTTTLGSTGAPFEVIPRLRVIQVFPSTLVFGVGDAPVTLDVQLTNADVFDHTIGVSVDDLAVAAISAATLAIPAGETIPLGTAQVAPQGIGVTRLRLSEPELQDQAISIYVTEPFQPVDGQEFFAAPVGVYVEPVSSPMLVEIGPFAAPTVGVQVGDAQEDSLTVTPVASFQLGLVVGPAITSVDPGRLQQGNLGSFNVRGFGLQNVDAVTVRSADAVTVSNILPGADGASVSFDLSADAAAAFGLRAVEVSASGKAILSADPTRTRIKIVGEEPMIDSMSPIVLEHGFSGTLTIRGVNLFEAAAVKVSPPDHIVLGSSPTTNADGTRVTVPISVGSSASTGDRVVTISARSGETDPTPSAANTIHIVEDIAGQITPIIAPLLGVTVGESMNAGAALDVRSNPIAVSVGPVTTGLRPAARAHGSQFTLQIDGVGLQAVDIVEFSPGDGVSVAAAVPSADGTAVSVDVAIDANAPIMPHAVRVFAAGQEIYPADAASMRFDVTAPLPELDSVAPQQVLVGASSTTMTVRGRNFGGAIAVDVIPSNDLVTSAPSVNLAGTELTFKLGVDMAAGVGTRTVVVVTSSGESDASPTAGNSFEVVAGQTKTLEPLIAPLIGVVVEASQTETMPVASYASLVGIVVDNSDQPEDDRVDVPASVLGVNVGPVTLKVSPHFVAVGSVGDLLIGGAMLDLVDGARVEPAHGVVISGPPVPSADGASVTLPVEIDPGAAQTIRDVQLFSAGTRIPSADPVGGTIQIVGDEPRIDSISPIQVIRGSTFTLIIRGVNFFDVTDIVAAPAQGVVFGNSPSVAADGRSLQVQVTVDPSAQTGGRAIQVFTGSGATTADATPANTLTILSN